MCVTGEPHRGRVRSTDAGLQGTVQFDDCLRTGRIVFALLGCRLKEGQATARRVVVAGHGQEGVAVGIVSCLEVGVGVDHGRTKEAPLPEKEWYQHAPEPPVSSRNGCSASNSTRSIANCARLVDVVTTIGEGGIVSGF